MFQCGGLTIAGALVVSGNVLAGEQQQELLEASVRTVLSARIGVSAGTHDQALAVRDIDANFPSTLDKVRWLSRMMNRLPKKWLPSYEQRYEFLQEVHYEATRAGLEPELVLGLIQIESNFRRYAISSAGARGFMQVMPFWVDSIGDGDASVLFNLRINLRFGCTILRHYLNRESGDLSKALARYNGSVGRDVYPNKVLGARAKWRKAALPGS